MKRVLTASISKEGQWYVAQALEADVASQGESVDDALANLREALELHFEPPFPRQSLNSSASRYRLPPVRPQPCREVARKLVVLRQAGLTPHEFDGL